MKLTYNRWIAVIWHTVVAILMMQACRFIYFYYNQSLLPPVDFLQLLRLQQGGFILDMVVIAYGLSLYYLLMIVGQFLPHRIEESKWFRVFRDLSYYIPFAFLLFLNISDTGYYPFVLRRANSDIFNEFQNKSMFSFYKEFVVDFWPLTLTFFILLCLGIVAYRWLRFRRADRRMMPVWANLLCSIALLVTVFFSMRGRWDFEGKPVPMSRVIPYMSDYRQLPILYNTPLALFGSKMSVRETFDFYTDQELAEIFSPYYQAMPLSPNDSLFGSMKGRNVVVILMESMASEYIGFYNPEYSESYSFTPFLDKLIPQTLYAKYGLSTGKRSVEAFPSIFVSLPSFGGTFNETEWTMNNYQHFSSYNTDLPTALSDNGYRLKFYHGDNEGALGFYPFLTRLTPMSQYTEESFMEEHAWSKEDRAETWGIHDMPFLSAAAEDMSTVQSQPFCSILFTLSNHHPYDVPKSLEAQYKNGTLPIHKTVQYADASLCRFFERIKDEPWYENTLFVLTADHTNLTDQPKYANTAGKAAVPIVFYDPQGKLKGCIDDYVVQHTDIFPTLLYLLGITDPILSYGHNIFDPDTEHIGLNFLSDQYILFAKEVTVLMTPTGEVTVEAPAPYLQTEPEKAHLPSEKTLERYKALLKAIVQDYNDRALHSKFAVEHLPVNPRKLPIQ
ncbi:MAG: LTA synthase family protein [Porphyromonas sp.]|nr:LTA synthase family protein [Porphyromonas sp.]